MKPERAESKIWSYVEVEADLDFFASYGTAVQKVVSTTPSAKHRMRVWTSRTGPVIAKCSVSRGGLQCLIRLVRPVVRLYFGRPSWSKHQDGRREVQSVLGLLGPSQPPISDRSHR